MFPSHDRRGQANTFCSSEIRFINEDNSAGKGAIAIAAGTNTLTEHLRVTSAGNVGIGTNNPVSKLTVESSANALADVDEPENHHLLLRNPANDTTEGVGMGFLVSVATNDVGAAIVCKRVGNNAQSELQFWNKQNTTVDGVITQSMTIAEDGNVGIGTNDPLSNLDVKTQIRVRDSSSDDTHVLLDSNGTDGRLRINNGVELGS